MAISCGRTTTSGYKATVASARKSIPVAVQIEEVYGDCDHFITHYGFEGSRGPWNTEVHFGGKYVLTMQVNVSIDYDAHTLTPVGKPRFWLLEIGRVEVNQKGRTMAITKSGMEFGMEEWNELYESDGDVSVIGFDPEAEEVENFDIYAEATRRPRERDYVSLLGEDD